MQEAEQQVKSGMYKAREMMSEEERMKRDALAYSANYAEQVGTLEIPKLDKSLPIVEGTDEDALDKGVGHLSNSVFPGQGEQILLAGHRDTVFRNFDKIKIGDQFIVNMPYGKFTYEIKHTRIVPEDDTSVIGKMGEEVLVVSTCYPFSYVGNAPDRFVAYAYPVKSEPIFVD